MAATYMHLKGLGWLVQIEATPQPHLAGLADREGMSGNFILQSPGMMSWNRLNKSKWNNFGSRPVNIEEARAWPKV